MMPLGSTCKYVYDRHMANQDAWRKLRQKLVEQGLDVVLSKGSNHYKVFRGKQLLTSMPSSSGGGRGYNNAKAQLKRLGIRV